MISPNITRKEAFQKAAQIIEYFNTAPHEASYASHLLSRHFAYVDKLIEPCLRAPNPWDNRKKKS